MIAPRRPTWSDAKHAAQWENTLATYVHPTLGKKLASDVTSADVLTVLTPIWTAKPETARRVRQRTKTVLDWAIAQGYRTDNPAGKAITKVLPRQPRVEAHHPAPPYEEVSAALERVRQGIDQAGLRIPGPQRGKVRRSAAGHLARGRLEVQDLDGPGGAPQSQTSCLAAYLSRWSSRWRIKVRGLVCWWATPWGSLKEQVSAG